MPTNEFYITYGKAWYEANREHALARSAARYAEKREEILAKIKARRAANPEKRRMEGKAYRDANSGKIKASYAVIFSTRDGYFRKLIRGGGRYSRNHITVANLISLWERQNGRCAVTGLSMSHINGHGNIANNASLDRIDNSRGYDLDNIRLVCARVNFMRSNLTDDELRVWCRAIIATLGKAAKKTT